MQSIILMASYFLLDAKQLAQFYANGLLTTVSMPFKSRKPTATYYA